MECRRKGPAAAVAQVRHVAAATVEVAVVLEKKGVRVRVGPVPQSESHAGGGRRTV
jgi:hypothetical protein